jgi:hypothetical protein
MGGSSPESPALVAVETEPVEQQLFAGAGAKVFLARLQIYKFLQNVTKTLNF